MDDHRFYKHAASIVASLGTGLIIGACTPLQPSSAEPSAVGAPAPTALGEITPLTSDGESVSAEGDKPEVPAHPTRSNLATSRGATSSVPPAASPSLTLSTPPALVAPPFSATATSSDGQWRVLGAEQSRDGLWRTVLHPNERSRFVSVDVVAVDLRRFRLAWVVGAGDVGASSLVGKQTPGLLDESSHRDVVAVFNGGFQARHGYWGQVSHGVTLVKPKAEGCGIALYDDGRVAVGSYDACAQAGLVTYRQAPPCLVTNGELNPRLLSGQDAVWAGKSSAEKTRRRSAVGLTADANTLYYLVGVETEPLDLARALKALGVAQGLQLDINWNWTRFFSIVNAADGVASLGAGLIEGMVADKGEYVRRPSKRDFFVILRRSAEQ